MQGRLVQPGLAGGTPGHTRGGRAEGDERQPGDGRGFQPGIPEQSRAGRPHQHSPGIRRGFPVRGLLSVCHRVRPAGRSHQQHPGWEGGERPQ